MATFKLIGFTQLILFNMTLHKWSGKLLKYMDKNIIFVSKVQTDDEEAEGFKTQKD